MDKFDLEAFKEEILKAKEDDRRQNRKSRDEHAEDIVKKLDLINKIKETIKDNLIKGRKNFEYECDFDPQAFNDFIDKYNKTNSKEESIKYFHELNDFLNKYFNNSSSTAHSEPSIILECVDVSREIVLHSITLGKPTKFIYYVYVIKIEVKFEV